MDGLRIKFVRVDTKLLRKTYVTQKLYPDAEEKDIRKIVYGVALFRFIDASLGAMLMVFDLHKVGPYRVGSLGLFAVGVGLAKPVAEVPMFDYQRLYIPCILLNECRAKLSATGCSIVEADTELNFLRPCYERILIEIHSAADKCGNEQARQFLWDQQSKRLGMVETRLKALLEQQASVEINNYEELAEELGKHLFSDRKRVKDFARACRILVELRPSLYKNRPKERCMLQIEFEIGQEKIVEFVDKEMLYLQGNDNTDFLFDNKKKMSITNASLRKKSQIDIAVAMIYGAVTRYSIEDALCLMPLFSQLNCDYIMENLQSFLENRCTVGHVHEILTTSRKISSRSHRDNLREFAQRLLKSELAGDFDRIMRLLPLCQKINKNL